MKKYLPVLLSLCLLLIGNSCSRSSSGKYRIVHSSKYKDIILKSRKELDIHKFVSGIPGISVAVYLKNELIWSEGIGYANKELNVPVEPDTKFRIGGVSELFTGALLARYIEDGELNLKTPVRQYYPELPDSKDSLTLYTLAAHTSGIRNPTYKELSNQGFQTMRKGLSVFIEDSLLFKPGEYYHETDYDYDLIGATLERKTGKTFHKLLKEKLTDTLHLATTETDNPVNIIEKRSQCYDRSMVSNTVRATTQDNRHRAASVGMLSSAVDIATLMNEYLHPALFKPETVKLILTQMTLKNGIKINNGLGLFVGKDNRGRDLYMSSGSTKGGSAAVIAYPEFDLIVAAACNQTDGQDDLPVFKIAGNFIGFLEPTPEKPRTKSEKKEQQDTATKNPKE